MQTSIEEISSKIYREIAQNFPVVSASDEFFYFPQVLEPDLDWMVWDRFSPEFIAEFSAKLSVWENEIDTLILQFNHGEPRLEAQSRLLKKITRTLREQLSDIRVWESQPSFYLSIICIGLAEAIEHGRYQAGKRVDTLPEFIEQAGKNLINVSISFQELGLEMIKDTRDYLVLLLKEFPGLSKALDALDRFCSKLKTITPHSDFRLSDEKISRVIEKHINCGIQEDEVRDILENEIDDMNLALAKAAKYLKQDTWQEAYTNIALPEMGCDGLVGLYHDEVECLGLHFLNYGLVSKERYQANSVSVLPVPTYLSAIRAASSYSIKPGHPPSGGVFYVINAHDPKEQKKVYNREYRILSAHETWPGHHLLDINRWELVSPVLRPVEQPIFYEGWACFAEEMLKMSGYIKNMEDVLIVAKRRLWRAIRGKVDLGLQTGTLTMDSAATLLVQTGVNRKQAESSARKYLLNPGYQLCYTIGLRQFLTLYDRYGNNDLAGFSQIVLQQGEICFEDLERILKLN